MIVQSLNNFNAFKWLLVYAQVGDSAYANCIKQDDTCILQSKKSIKKESTKEKHIIAITKNINNNEVKDINLLSTSKLIQDKISEKCTNTITITKNQILSSNNLNLNTSNFEKDPTMIESAIIENYTYTRAVR